MKTVSRQLRQRLKAQTALEYFFIIAMFVLPLAFTIKNSLENSDQRDEAHIVENVTKSAFGDDDSFGIIGAPYP